MNVTIVFEDCQNNTGGLAGEVISVTENFLIQNVTISGTIVGSDLSTDAIGGLIGGATGDSDNAVNIYDCSTDVDIDVSFATTKCYDIGGLIGIATYVNVFNCHSTGDIVASGGLSNCFYIGGLIILVNFRCGYMFLFKNHIRMVFENIPNILFIIFTA